MRDLRAVVKAIRIEAASLGFCKSPWGQHQRLQIMTVAELLDARRIDMPRVRQTSVTYKRAPRAAAKAAECGPLNLEEPD